MRLSLHFALPDSSACSLSLSFGISLSLLGLRPVVFVLCLLSKSPSCSAVSRSALLTPEAFVSFDTSPSPLAPSVQL